MANVDGERATCTRCGADNRAGRRFCAQCGAALALTCTACGFDNEPGERFCGGCGAGLAGVVSGAPAEEPGDAERRPVTVLFADVCGYTRMSEGRDPEEMRELLQRYFAAVDAIIERFGGRVDKHIGDAVMALFGAPIAHGDDALRAVRAADAIVHAMPEVSDAAGTKLEVHVGLAAGEVIASGVGSDAHRAYTVIGPSVNLAARLTDVAGAGEIVLDAAVHAAVADDVRCVALEARTIKGIERPVRAWKLASARVARNDNAARPFVGRVGELAQLSAVIRTCVQGPGAIVYVRGEPGIGKSRLATEFRRLAAQEGFVCHTGLVLDFGTARGRDPIRDIVGSLLGLSPSATTEDRHAALEAAMARGACAPERHASLADFLDVPLSAQAREAYLAMDNASRQRARNEVLGGLMQWASRDAALLVCIEDLHWADRVTLEHVAAIAQAVRRARLIVALTTRPEGDPLAGAWRASLQRSPILTLDLAPLSDEEAQRLAAGVYASSARIAQKCVERAAGNPLFLEQLLRAAEEHEDRLPVSLQSLVLARVDRLPERDRVALRAAAVIGQRFSIAALRHLSGFHDYECGVLLAHFLVQPEGDDFLFAHALIRDGVYASLTRVRRAELHRAAAQWYGERDPTLRAEHLERAESPQAANAYLVAAAAQSSEAHPERALALAERGAALARDPADVHGLDMLRGALYLRAGEGSPAVEAYRSSLSAAATPAERCRALLGIASGARLLADADAALAALAEAEPIAAAHGLTRESAELHYIRGNIYFAFSDPQACRAEHEAAHACALSLGDAEWQARTLSGLADADYAAGRMCSALARFALCVELSEAHGLVRVAMPNRVMMGACRIYMLEFDAGIADMEASRALAVRLGDRHGEMFALESIGMLLTLAQRHAESLPIYERGLALAEAIGARRYATSILAGRAHSLFDLGRVDEAHESLERALAVSREMGMRFCGPWLLAIRARMQHDAAERQRCREEAEALISQGSIGHNPIAYHCLGMEDAIARREWPRAVQHADALDRYTCDEPLPYTEFMVARGRALVALAADREDASRARIASLRAEAARLGWPISWPAWAGDSG